MFFCKKESVRRTFALLDTDRNGVISKEEWRRAMQLWMLRTPELEHNLTVVNCTVPAQYFHVLRRQVGRTTPLVVATPKMLLRHRPCVSALDELAEGTFFRAVLPDPCITDHNAVRAVVMCSGQVYWVLRHALAAHKVKHVALVRLEQLSPFPYVQVARATLLHYPQATFHWAQEEHKNMGGWAYVKPRFETLRQLLSTDLAWMRPKDAPPLSAAPLTYIGRPASPCATGSATFHSSETQEHVVSPCLSL